MTTNSERDLLFKRILQLEAEAVVLRRTIEFEVAKQRSLGRAFEAHTKRKTFVPSTIKQICGNHSNITRGKGPRPKKGFFLTEHLYRSK